MKECLVSTEHYSYVLCVYCYAVIVLLMKSFCNSSKGLSNTFTDVAPVLVHIVLLYSPERLLNSAEYLCLLIFLLFVSWFWAKSCFAPLLQDNNEQKIVYFIYLYLSTHTSQVSVGNENIYQLWQHFHKYDSCFTVTNRKITTKSGTKRLGKSDCTQIKLCLSCVERIRFAFVQP